MKTTTFYLRRIRMELQELLGIISIHEIITNNRLTRHYELAHQQLLEFC